MKYGELISKEIYKLKNEFNGIKIFEFTFNVQLDIIQIFLNQKL